MSNVTHRSHKEEIRAKLETAIKELSANGLPSLSAAFRSLLAAIEYDDRILIDSTINMILEDLQKFVEWVIPQWYDGFERCQESLRDLWKLMSENPLENYDDVRKVVEEGLADALEQRTKLRDGLVKTLQTHGYEVTKTQQLDQDIERLMIFKKKILDSWPLSSRPLPPVNKEMIAAAKARRARGERGESIEDLIHRLGGEPTTNT